MADGSNGMFNHAKFNKMSDSAADVYFRRQWFKNKAKKANAGKRDRLAASMLYRERTHVSEYPENWVHYGFILPEDIIYDYDPEATPTEWDAYLDLTDEEIDEWIDDHMRVCIFSDYDCTGRAFTTGITWHRNPSGLISYVHHMALDI